MKLTKTSVLIIGFYVALVFLWFSASIFDTGTSLINLSTIFNGFKHNQTYGSIYNMIHNFVPIFVGIYGIYLAAFFRPI